MKSTDLVTGSEYAVEVAPFGIQRAQLVRVASGKALVSVPALRPAKREVPLRAIRHCWRDFEALAAVQATERAQERALERADAEEHRRRLAQLICHLERAGAHLLAKELTAAGAALRLTGGHHVTLAALEQVASLVMRW